MANCKAVGVATVIGLVILAFGAQSIIEDIGIKCGSGAQLVSLLAGPSAGIALIASDLTLTEQDWSGYSLPITLTQNFTISASRLVTIDMGFLKAKIRLAAGVVLHFAGVALVNYRSGSGFQAPGLDLLAPMPAGEQAELHFTDGFLVSPFCFAVTLLNQAVGTAVRPPAFPGVNVVDVPVPLPAAQCTNSTAAPALDRCYAYAGRYTDFGVYCADVQPNGRPAASGYIAHFLNFTFLCPTVLSDDCVAHLGPVGCVLYTLALMNGTATANGSAVAAPTAGADSAAGAGGSSSSGSGRARKLGGTLGGALSAAAVALVIAAAIVRWRLAQRGAAPLPSSKAPGLAACEAAPSHEAADGGCEPGSSVEPETAAATTNHTHVGAGADPEWGFGLSAPGQQAGERAPGVRSGEQRGVQREQHQGEHHDGANTVITASTPQRPGLRLDVRIRPSQRYHGTGSFGGCSGSGSGAGAGSGVGSGGANVCVQLDGPGPAADHAAPDASASGGGSRAAAAAAVAPARGDDVTHPGTASGPASGVGPKTGERNSPAREAGNGNGSGETAAGSQVTVLPTALGEEVSHPPDSAAAGAGADRPIGHAATAVASNEVTLLPTVLGMGASGRVYQGLYQGLQVAVKVIGGMGLMELELPSEALYLSSTQSLPTQGQQPGVPQPLRPQFQSPQPWPHQQLQASVQEDMHPPPAPSPDGALDTSGSGSGTHHCAAASSKRVSGHTNTTSRSTATASGTLAYQDVPSGGVVEPPPPLGGISVLTATSSGPLGDSDDKGAVGTAAITSLPLLLQLPLPPATGGGVASAAAGDHDVMGQPPLPLPTPVVEEEEASPPAGLDSWQRRLGQLFAAEVEVLGRCCHPNVVRLLAACVTPPRLCLVMERMETSLEQLLYGRSPRVLLPLPTVLHLAVQVCRGLEYLHPTVIHRDLKPANVLINGADSPQPVAKLSDFGLSRIRSVTLPTLHAGAGTPAYLAPECYDVNNKVVTHHADMYAMGVLLWAMLSGQEPWKDHSLMAVAYKVAVLQERPPLDHMSSRRCPPKLRRLIRRCWDADPLRRPGAAEALKELLLLQAHQALQPPHPAQPHLLDTELLLGALSQAREVVVAEVGNGRKVQQPNREEPAAEAGVRVLLGKEESGSSDSASSRSGGGGGPELKDAAKQHGRVLAGCGMGREVAVEEGGCTELPYSMGLRVSVLGGFGHRPAVGTAGAGDAGGGVRAAGGMNVHGDTAIVGAAAGDVSRLGLRPSSSESVHMSDGALMALLGSIELELGGEVGGEEGGSTTGLGVL